MMPRSLPSITLCTENPWRSKLSTAASSMAVRPLGVRMRMSAL